MLKAPTEQSSKYSQLLSVYRELYTEAKTSDVGWKDMLATVMKMCDALANNTSGLFSDVDSSLSHEP
eukprot:snap_masked-scaffold_5-processed-gene-7.41-mRNA-1 protein AED:1.00 eAED:1.00 QI:0/-1/0/0/-1/1/1/0/66